ncbi:fused signal recognition particle receptor [Capronia coronata CBS 617.96]|uniref:Signal recognition particle receptor subunit alpha homolog n=1 Tax=Capronia coronata CBS 617.96 TaxID=1182541 RepID=W9XJJ8_9EURO|nr:fused signal recognition particle receptor [Capronia coronata CBS 617.96]EXJ80343.1 fused signal recognition particle receptor [Capronia coronata CBS 617.96]
MLDAFEILTTSGVVLWSRSTSNIGAIAVNSLINDVFIEEKVRPPVTNSGHPAYKHDKYTLKYTLVKDLGLMFVAVYQSLLHLTWVDKLLDDIRTIFVEVYRGQLEELDYAVLKYPFDKYYDEELRRLDQTTGGAVSAEIPRVEVQEEKKVNAEKADTGGPPPPELPQLLKAQPRAVPTVNGEVAEDLPAQSPDSPRPTSPLPGVAGHLLTEKARPASRGSRRARKAVHAATTNASSGDETRRPRTPQKAAKKGRVWGPDGMADEADDKTLDYSAVDSDATGEAGVRSPPPEAISQESWGTKNKQGQFVLKDLGDEVTKILKSADSGKAETNGTGATKLGAISGYFRNIVGGKTLTKEDLEKPLKAMEEHLISKNVAREAAVRIRQGVEEEMIGKKTGAFESIETALRPALETSLRRILTPRSSLDLLQQIETVAKPSGAKAKPRPFVITILGVNGVGKSTNLSKLCYFLLQNNYRVLIAAGDTFRSGAVEQLNVHVRNLKELTARENLGAVDIYERGYGKDAANVAKDAVAFAAANDYQVVLVDTAGRAHTNTQLMASLEKLVDLAKPDLILQVAEALVGNDSVGQAQNFTKALGKNRKLDGFIVSKIDTVGSGIGTMISLVHATSVPVQFIGVGQHYGDLRQLSVPWAVNMLMS